MVLNAGRLWEQGGWGRMLGWGGWSQGHFLSPWGPICSVLPQLQEELEWPGSSPVLLSSELVRGCGLVGQGSQWTWECTFGLKRP